VLKHYSLIANKFSKITMNLNSKKISLLILGITSLVFSRVMFLFFNDPEGPNVLVVIGMAVIIYFLSLAIYLFKFSNNNSKKLLLAICIQIVITAGFYFFLK
jgi:hypothetical protein